MTSKALKNGDGSVGLVGDLDDVELLEHFERLFAITISDCEAETMATLGDAFDIICAKLPEDPQQQTKCLTAMAFYRLNKGLRANGKISPATILTLPEGMTPEEFQVHLESKSGLELDFLTKPNKSAEFLLWFQLVSWISAPVFLSGFTALFCALGIFAVSHLTWRVADRMDGRVWVFEGTIADLAKKAAQKNLGALINQGGKWDETQVWNSMTSLIHSYTGFPVNEMKPELRFIS